MTKAQDHLKMVQDQNEAFKLVRGHGGELYVKDMGSFGKVGNTWYAGSNELHTNDGWLATEVPSWLFGHLNKLGFALKNILRMTHEANSNTWTVFIPYKKFYLFAGDVEMLLDKPHQVVGIRTDNGSVQITFQG